MTGLSGIFGIVVQFAIGFGAVLVATSLFRLLLNMAIALLTGRRRGAGTTMLLAHLLSLFVVGFLATVGAGVGDFPTLQSFLIFVLVFIGPPQGVLLAIDIFRHLRRGTR